MTVEEWIKAIKYGNQGVKRFTVPVEAMPKKRWVYEGWFLSLNREWDANGTPYYAGYCGGVYAPTPAAAEKLLRNPPPELEEALSYVRDHAPHRKWD